MPVNLVLDLVGSIRHEDARIDVGRAHFRLRPLKGGEELGMDQSGLGVFELRCYVSRQAEVWVLIDCAWDKTGYIGDRAEDLREGIGKRWGGLDSGEVDFSNVVPWRNISQLLPYGGTVSAYESLKPKAALACEMVIWREILEMFL